MKICQKSYYRPLLFLLRITALALAPRDVNVAVCTCI